MKIGDKIGLWTVRTEGVDTGHVIRGYPLYEAECTRIGTRTTITSKVRWITRDGVDTVICGSRRRCKDGVCGHIASTERLRCRLHMGRGISKRMDYLAADTTLLARAVELRDNPAILSTIPEIAVLSARLETQLASDVTVPEVLEEVAELVPRLRAAFESDIESEFERALSALQSVGMNGRIEDWEDIRCNISAKARLLELDRKAQSADSQVVPLSFVTRLMDQFFTLLGQHVADPAVVEVVRGGCIQLLESRVETKGGTGSA